MMKLEIFILISVLKIRVMEDLGVILIWGNNIV